MTRFLLPVPSHLKIVKADPEQFIMKLLICDFLFMIACQL